MILVTGAAGKTGRAIMQALTKRGHAVRGWVKPGRAGAISADSVFEGDMRSPTDWSKALTGITKLYLICPNMHPGEFEIGRVALNACVESNVGHLVYHSVLHPQTERMPHHWHKLRVEEAILESGVPFTILQPTAYMQNLLPQWASMATTGKLRLPYPAESAISLIDLADLAAVAVQVLSSDQFQGATLECVGSRPLNQTDVAAILSEERKVSIRFEEVSLQEWEANNSHLPNYTKSTLLRMFRYYADFGLHGNPFVLAQVLGRAPTSLRAWVRLQSG